MLAPAPPGTFAVGRHVSAFAVQSSAETTEVVAVESC